MHRVRHALDDASVERVCFSGAAESGRATLRIDSKPIADAELAVPSGYTPMSLALDRGAAKP